MKSSIITIALVAVLLQGAWAFRDLVEHTLHHPNIAEVEAEVFNIDEDLLKWEKDMVDFEQLAAPDPDEIYDRDTEPWVEQISVEPRAYIYHNFFTHEEADHIIRLAVPYMTKSKVISPDNGEVIRSVVRTSSGAWIQRGQDAGIAEIEQRIANWTGAPVENAEPMHVLHYEKGEQYKEHYDYYFDSVNIINGGQRAATVLLYLSDVEEGGETVFPMSVDKPSAEEAEKFSECARQGAAAKARKGDALLFFSMLPDGETMDERSLHAGCPVIKGEKWVATKWLRVEEWIDAPLSQLEDVKRERELLRQRELQALINQYADREL